MINKIVAEQGVSTFNNRNDEKEWLNGFLKIRAIEFCEDNAHINTLAILSTFEDLIDKDEDEDIYFDLNGEEAMMSFIIEQRNYHKGNQAVIININQCVGHYKNLFLYSCQSEE